jgi:hypothetical protein
MNIENIMDFNLQNALHVKRIGLELLYENWIGKELEGGAVNYSLLVLNMVKPQLPHV